VVLFGVFIHTAASARWSVMTSNPSSRFNGFRTNYEGKPLKRFFISKTHC